MNLRLKKSTIADIIILAYMCNVIGDALNLMVQNLIVFIALVFLVVDGSDRLMRTIKSTYGVWLIGFVAFIFVGRIWAISPSSVANMGKTILKMSIVLFFIFGYTNTYEQLIKRIKQFMFATVFMMVRVVLAFVSGYSRLDAFTYGVGMQFNSVAQILALTIIVAIWFVLNDAKLQKKLWITPYTIYIAAAFAMIIWSGSRKSILIPIIGLLLIIIMGEFGIKRQFRYLILAILVGIVALYVVSSNDLLSSRFVDLFETMFRGGSTDVSALERKYYRETAALLFIQNPIVGLGAEGFMNYLRNIGYSHVAYCHNNWLEILSAFGIIGGIIYYWFYMKLFLGLKKSKRVYGRMGVVLLSTLVVLFVFEYGIVTYYFPMYHILFCFMAIFLKCSYMTAQKEESNG